MDKVTLDQVQQAKDAADEAEHEMEYAKMQRDDAEIKYQATAKCWREKDAEAMRLKLTYELQDKAKQGAL